MPDRNRFREIQDNEVPKREKFTDPLAIIPEADWPTLRDLFKTNWPEIIFVYYFIDNYINWKKKNKSTNIVFYSLDGKWRDGTFIALLTDQNYAVIYSNSPESRDWRGLARTKMLAWRQGIMLGALHSSVQSPLLQALINELNLYPIKEIPCNYHWIPKELAVKFESSAPKGYHFDDLKIQHASLINSYWPHSFPGSLKFISDQVEYNGGVGLYEDESNELICWILRNNYGGLGILHTIDAHRRKGFAELITRRFCRKLAENGRDVFAATVVGNVSTNLFEKLGFQTIGMKSWYQF